MFHGSADGGEVAEVDQVLHRRTKRFVAQARSVGKGGKIIFDVSLKATDLPQLKRSNDKKNISRLHKTIDVGLWFSLYLTANNSLYNGQVRC
jgi:hypothetical protein